MKWTVIRTRLARKAVRRLNRLAELFLHRAGSPRTIELAKRFKERVDDLLLAQGTAAYRRSILRMLTHGADRAEDAGDEQLRQLLDQVTMFIAASEVERASEALLAVGGHITDRLTAIAQRRPPRSAQTRHDLVH